MMAVNIWKILFKFQSDSINTDSRWLALKLFELFKFQSDSINTLLCCKLFTYKRYLNSNLILLILVQRH